MKTWSGAVLLGLWLALHSHAALAEQAAIIAPVCYNWSAYERSDLPAMPGKVKETKPSNRGPIECDSDISLDDAKSSYREITQLIPKCVARAKNQKAKIDCRQLFTAIDYNVCDDEKTLGWYHFWAPMEDFADGRAAFARLSQRAMTGQTFDGHVIVESNSSTKDRRHLALCEVITVSNVSGPPTNCVTVAIVGGGEIWMRGGNPHQSLCFSSASFRATGAIDIHWRIDTQRSPAELGAAILKMLSDSLGLTSKMQEERGSVGDVMSVDLTSAAAFQVSTVLPGGWRNAVDFDVQIYERQDASGAEWVSLQGVAHVLISKGNPSALVDYTPLSDAQKAIYAAALDSRIAEAIESVCRVHKEVDSDTIICK